MRNNIFSGSGIDKVHVVILQFDRSVQDFLRDLLDLIFPFKTIKHKYRICYNIKKIKDVEDWDSIGRVRLTVTLEERFKK